MKSKESLSVELTRTISAGDTAGIQRCLLLGGDPNAPLCKDGWPPLCHAAASGHVKGVATLLAHGADPNRSIARGMGRGMVPLAFCRDAATARALLRAGARPNVFDQRGWTPLDWAMHMGRQSVVAILEQASQSPSSVAKPALTRRGPSQLWRRGLLQLCPLASMWVEGPRRNGRRGGSTQNTSVNMPNKNAASARD